jgi:hypothetical protein
MCPSLNLPPDNSKGVANENRLLSSESQGSPSLARFQLLPSHTLYYTLKYFFDLFSLFLPYSAKISSFFPVKIILVYKHSL